MRCYKTFRRPLITLGESAVLLGLGHAPEGPSPVKRPCREMSVGPGVFDRNAAEGGIVLDSAIGVLAGNDPLVIGSTCSEAGPYVEGSTTGIFGDMQLDVSTSMQPPNLPSTSLALLPQLSDNIGVDFGGCPDDVRSEPKCGVSTTPDDSTTETGYSNHINGFVNKEGRVASSSGLVVDQGEGSAVSETHNGSTFAGSTFDPDVESNVCQGLHESIPSFCVGGEDGTRFKPRFLIWAYDVLRNGWWRLVPFPLSDLSVFALAKRAAAWASMGGQNVTLEALCYRVGVCRQHLWNRSQFLSWLTIRRRHETDWRSGCGALADDQGTGTTIAAHLVNDALYDLLRGWSRDDQFINRKRLRQWWQRSSGRFQADSSQSAEMQAPLPQWEFEAFFVKLLGDWRVPLNAVPREFRRARRRRKVQTAAVATSPVQTGRGETNTSPSFLVAVDGTSFPLATQKETGLRLAPRFLVWAYDIMYYGWWGAVPKIIVQRVAQSIAQPWTEPWTKSAIQPAIQHALSVFGLAKKIWQWNDAGNPLTTLDMGPYVCDEGYVFHSDTDHCERCDRPWNVHEFWEWLQSRHFARVCIPLTQLSPNGSDQTADQTADQTIHKAPNEYLSWIRSDGGDRAKIVELINEIGFNFPETGSRDERRVVSFQLFTPLQKKGEPSFRQEMHKWWFRQAECLPISSNGLTLWEWERVMMIRASSSLGYTPI
ncbi:hypothetical protein GNI_087590 [Gregarina niphandrodes]|uniref:Uncharacterized protein n=1 Tax=Gregarina niphandrodes TaxID=110365 RepID=A0A023B630_GRENI|nr:hypothetical protein GNI_087590 [Gregarina niphandrodes]EZG62798.1 hypothetical protein GNI_087590 [Gregarina niphandrodes]|eukprot:XP_011130719.1 hypothetical protein GNI_087590 [Gregarina niphandrodes]